MATIALSPIPPIPSPGDKDFETKIGRVLSHMPTLATELKTIAETVVESAQLVDVEGNATVAATAASQASLSANTAMSAAGTAATQANTAKAEATKAARSKSDAALAASQAGTNAQAAMAAAARAEDAVLAAEAIATAKAEEVATQAAADAATQAVSGVIAQAQASADAAALSATDANTAKNAAQAAATTAGQSVAAIATHAQTAQTASTAASTHAHNAGLRAAESLASAQQATSAGQAATQGAADVREILDNLSTGPVVSVNGKYGAVNLVPADVGAAPDAHVGATGTAHGTATTSVAGFMSATDKTKLDGVAKNANNYSHPASHPASIIAQDASNRFVTDAEKTAWNEKEASGTAAAAMSAHTGATDPHSQYLPKAGGTMSGPINFAPAQTWPAFNQSTTGNAGTATKLATARTINGVSFDGTANITVNAVDSTAREPAIAAGTTAQYWRGDKSWRDFFTDVRAATLTGLSTATNAVIGATDTVLGALGKLQKQVSDNLTTLTSHTGSTSNPHSVTKAQVGLGNVDNTSDADKPVSTATQTALNLKANAATTVEQSDIGTGPNEIPLNQHLGDMAFQNANALVIKPAASATPQQVGSMVFQLTSDTQLVVKVKGSDGTVRSATLTLA